MAASQRYRDRHPPVPQADGHSFCESATAGLSGRWCIRKLDQDGHKFTGGITTESLCGYVKPVPEGFGGWDIDVPINEQHLQHCCQRCASVMLGERAA